MWVQIVSLYINPLSFFDPIGRELVLELNDIVQLFSTNFPGMYALKKDDVTVYLNQYDSSFAYRVLGEDYVQ